MSPVLTEKHIFISRGLDEVCLKFLEKISAFHEFYLDEIIIQGENLDLLNLPDFNVEFNDSYSEDFFCTFLPCLLSSQNIIEICHRNDFYTNNYNIHYLNDTSSTEGFYATEGYQDSNLEDSSLKIYKMNKRCNLLNINNFWLDE